MHGRRRPRATARRARPPRGATRANAPSSRGGGSVENCARAPSLSAANPRPEVATIGQHGHAAERLLQPGEVDLEPFALGRVDHRQRDDHRPAELDELLEQIEPLVEPRRVDDRQDRFRRGVPATRPNSTSTAICSSAEVGLSEYVPGRSMRSSDTPPNTPRPTRRSTVTPG